MKRTPRSWRFVIANAVTAPERSATREPLFRVVKVPNQGSWPSWMECAMPVPRVPVRNSVRKPIRPRDGTTNSMRTQPEPWLDMLSIRPLRTPMSCVTAPMCSSGTSIVIRSTGSWTLPSISGDHLRLADGRLEALPAHGLDEDRERQLTAALHLPGIRALGVQDAQRDIADQFAVEAVLDLRAVTLRP